MLFFWVTTGEAVVGCRDANWACGNSAITNILYYLLFGWWEMLLLIRMLRVLGQSLDQQGVGNSTC
jgi:uncharacterized membrane protein YccF (DUF307 family)